MDQLTSPQGTFELARYPVRKKETLRAWDAADEYLLQQIAEQENLSAGTRILIVNDQFGSLTVALNQHSPEMITDSWLSICGTENNYQINDLSLDRSQIHNSLSYPDTKFDLVLIKVPKSLAMLEDQLIRLRPLLKEDSQIIAGGMAKNIHTSTLKLFEKLIGPTKTSLARKKARLIFPQLELDRPVKTSPYPTQYILENSDFIISNHAAVFSRESLDIGTRFFLQHLPKDDRYEQIIDLGCGNGVVGVIAAEKNPAAKVTFVDESCMAVASAKQNFITAHGATRPAEFIWTDCLTGIAPESADLVLNNPPFHQQHSVGDFIALQMFRESKKVLKKDGELWVIGNRHLGYHQRLKKLFGNCELIASNKKFVILKAIRK